MDKNLKNGLITYGGQMASNVLGAIVSNYFSKNAATTAYNRQKELISDERNYMSPSSQMSRLKEAGLNPNLIYGSLGQAGSTPTAPQAETHAMSPIDIAQLKMANMQSKDLQSQIDAREADTKLKRDQFNFEKHKFETDYQNRVYMQGYEVQRILSEIGVNNQMVEKLKADIEKVNSEALQIQAETKLTQKQIDTFDERFKAEIAHLRAQTNLLSNQAESQRLQNQMTTQMMHYLTMQQLSGGPDAGEVLAAQYELPWLEAQGLSFTLNARKMHDWYEEMVKKEVFDAKHYKFEKFLQDAIAILGAFNQTIETFADFRMKTAIGVRQLMPIPGAGK